MRAEVQPWNAITARLEMVSGAGVGQTGLSPTAQIKRLLDGKYWNGATWQVGVTSVVMSEVDAVNEPGVYEAAVLPAQLSYSFGLKGYRFQVAEATKPALEYGFILQQRRSSHDDVVTDHVTSGTFGHRLAMALGVGGQFWHRIKSPTYDVEGRLLTAQMVAYPTSADADADTNEIGHIDITVTYDVNGNMATLKAL